jgi:membrane protein DedA with SNARE-associated domain
MHEIFVAIENWYMIHLNYGTITLLMAIESSFIPFPSEVVIPPAAWLAAQGKLNLFLVIVFSTIGALIGATFNYYFAYFLGRPIIYKLAGNKFAKFLLITPESVEKSELYFKKHGAVSTFVGRLVPAVRQLISIPAGLARMKLSTFLLYTTLGAALWNTILAILGFYLYSQKELLEKYYNEIWWTFIILGILFVAYLVFKTYKKSKAKTTSI